MPITVESIENGHILFIVPSERWDMLDVRQAQAKILAHIESVDFIVHSLLDLQHVHRPPSHVIGTHGLNMLHDPRRGYLAIYGASRLLRSICNVLFRMEQFHMFRIFVTREQALDFLHSVIAAEHDTGPLRKSAS